MRIFALETNVEKAARKFLSAGEQAQFIIRYHPFLFFVRALRQGLLTIVMIAAAIGLELLQVPAGWLWGAVFLLWLAFVFPGVIRAYIDWRFDAIVVTNDNVIILDQTSIFHSEVRQMHLENFASVNASTQFWNIFPFGQVCFDLKEGIGQRVCLRYIPRAEEIAFKLSNAVRAFQRSAGSAVQGAHVAASLMPQAPPPVPAEEIV